MKKGFLVFMLLVLVLFTYEESMVKVTEARMCSSNGHAFSCVNDWRCSISCERQGFTSGNCKGFHRRCRCYKPCA